MMTYKQWCLLKESFGTFNLGVTQKQGFAGFNGQVPASMTSKDLGIPQIDEMGMRMPRYMGDDDSMGFATGKPSKMGKKPFPPVDDEEMGDEENLGDDEMGDEENPDEMGDEEMGDEEDSIDPEAEFDDEEEGDMGDDMGDDMGMPMKKKKKPMMGEPHDVGPFMKWSKRMKEGCGDDVDGDDIENIGDEDDDEMPKKGKELAFLQKKQKKFQKKMAAGDTAAKSSKLGKPRNDGKPCPKGDGGVSKGTPENQKYHTGKLVKKCSDGMDKKCSKCAKQKKEAAEYARPSNVVDQSDEAFVRSLKSMYGNPWEKFSDGMRDFSEDMLLPTPEPKPGDVGFAPQTRVGTDVNAMGETVEHLLKKINKLEEQLKKKK